MHFWTPDERDVQRTLDLYVVRIVGCSFGRVLIRLCADQGFSVRFPLRDDMVRGR